MMERGELMDYREVRQIAVCSIPLYTLYERCVGYKPYSKSRGLLRCVYSLDFPGRILCTRPANEPGGDG
jgi:hypothetical protein